MVPQPIIKTTILSYLGLTVVSGMERSVFPETNLTLCSID